MLPIFDLSSSTQPSDLAGFERILTRLRATASASGDAATTVAQIVDDVATRGDDAVVHYMRKWTDPAFSSGNIRVTAEELAGAQNQAPKDVMSAIGRAIEHVRAYQQHIKPADAKPITIAGAELGLRYTPVDSAGLYVPGGTAVLFSTLIMLAVPAMVAGVDPRRISVVCPPATRGRGGTGVSPVQRGKTGGTPVPPLEGGDISPIVLATAHRLGIKKVYRLGGAQAMAALAYGTKTVEAVDLIAGPGNVFVQLAKARVSGKVGTDNGFYGPSEIVTIADESANPAYVAADLLAQAEHNPGKCFLIVWSRAVLGGILDEITRQFGERSRAEAIAGALKNESAAVIARDVDHAIEIANTLAAEHVNLAVAEPETVLSRLRHAGEVFLGDQTPVAAGDYYAGPSHCLPTGTTARFTSGISVHTFLQRTGTVAYPDGMPAQAIDDIAVMAQAEGLDAHAASARVRGTRT